LNEHDAVLSAASVALHSTDVTPSGKIVWPNCGQVTVTLPLLSVATAGDQLNEAVREPGDVATSELPGQDMTGGVTSATSTVNEQLAVLPDVSVALQATLAAPSPKEEPDTGLHTTEAMATLSVAVGAA
jgi:hypothetical protein